MMVVQTKKTALKSKESLKQSRKDIEKLRREVFVQNRKLIAICFAVLVFGILLLFTASHIATWLTPKTWTYENAVIDVLDGKINENQYVYNGIIFARQNNESLWIFQGKVRNQTFEITSYYGPEELELVSVPLNVVNNVYSKKALFLSLNSSLDNVPTAAANAAIGAIEVGKIVGTKNNILNKQTMTTVTDSVASGINSSLSATCLNASNVVGVIQFELSNTTQVIGDKNCLVVQGSSPTDIIKAADRLVFEILGIMRTTNSSVKVQ